MKKLNLANFATAVALQAASQYQQPKMKLGSLTRLIDKLLMDPALSYDDIVARCKEEFPNCNTTTRSVASIACVHRRKGTANVPMRVKVKEKQLSLI